MTHSTQKSYKKTIHINIERRYIFHVTTPDENEIVLGFVVLYDPRSVNPDTYVHPDIICFKGYRLL